MKKDNGLQYMVLDKLGQLGWYVEYNADPSEVKTIGQHLEEMEDALQIKRCAVCEDYTKIKDLHVSRFDQNELVCPDCRMDDN